MHNLEVVYGDVIRVLRGVSLDVPSGAVVALLGANGAGKTTLLRALSGLLVLHRGRVTKGVVELQGRPIGRLDAPAIVALGVAQVMEGRRIFSELTVEENLRVGGYCRRRDRAGLAASFDRVMELFPVLAHRRRSTAGYLSGGEQQMLAIGRALMASPRLLLLDEPSLGLAPQAVEQIGRIIRDINAQGTTVLLVEQNAAMALSIATRAFVMSRGRVVLEGSGPGLMDNPELRHSYLGTTQPAPSPPAEDFRG
ncbi:MAG: ABC transporter ATP-binding protein [Actinobacteria bacterium]|nr:ABC transporter ATP-binding protein [Actinomycetota bacterium]